MTSISVVIPVFNAAQNIETLHIELSSALQSLGEQYEIIFVEDQSSDDSWAKIKQLASNDQRVRGIGLSRNYGQHSALLCGIRAAEGDVVITMDDDLQHPPGQLPKLLDKFKQGFDVVYGAPEKESHGILRGMASRITKWVLQNAMGAETAGQVSALRVFRTSLRDAFEDYRSPFVNIDVMLTWATTRFGVVKVRHEERKRGTSGYTIRMLLRHAFNMMTGFSALPLQIASITGFLFALFGLFVLAYVIFVYLVVGSAVPGFAFLASIIAIFSGAQLLAIGVIGEYLVRIHFRTMDRPPYVVKEKTDEAN